MALTGLNIMLKITKLKHFISHLKRAVVVYYSDNALYIANWTSEFTSVVRSQITF